MHLLALPVRRIVSFYILGKEKVFTVATKQLLVQKLPAILTLHLKRFEQVGGGRLRKITKLIQFPKELNMAPFCSSFSDVS